MKPHGTILAFGLAILHHLGSVAQSEIYFEQTVAPLEIERVFVLAGDSEPCEGVELSADDFAEYAEVRLLAQYEVLDKQKLGMSGLLNEDEVVEAGCLQGSDGIVFCEVGCLAGRSMIKLKLVDCKESVQQWSAMGLDTEVGSVLDRVLGKGEVTDIRGQEQVESCGVPVEYNGYDYQTVRIGKQCWFAENLRTEKYRNNEPILSNLGGYDWYSAGFDNSGAVAVYGELGYGDEDEPFMCTEETPEGDACDPVWSLDAFGRLYNWYAVVDSRGLCPKGWRVPSDEDWTEMELAAIGTRATEGRGWRKNRELYAGQLSTSSGWSDGQFRTDSVGFSGMPGGRRQTTGSYNHAGWLGEWWSSSLNESGRPSESNEVSRLDYAWYRLLDWDFTRRDGEVGLGMSVRCVRDIE